MAFQVTPANIKDFPDIPEWQTLHEMVLTGQQTKGGVILWQAVMDSDDEGSLRTLAGWYHYVENKVPANVPISWDSERWVLVESGYKMLHHGVAGWSANRFIQYVVLRRRFRNGKLGGQIAFVNAHFIPAVFSPKRRGTKGWARARIEWYKGKKALIALVAELAARGIPVMGGGDYNRRNSLRPRVLGERIKVKGVGRLKVAYHTPPSAIDWLWSIDSKRRGFNVSGMVTLGRKYTDHAARRVVVSMKHIGGKR